jgi:cell wall-associated NlpC family hydrolase
VNYVYRRAHLPYRYASSEELYEGVDSFQRVYEPMPGDLIVWKGHVGIVTDPNENRFVSVLRSGVKTDDYLSRYWKSRGRPRFLRYLGNRPAQANRTLAKSVVAAYASGE